jgi:hypothetical protein
MTLYRIRKERAWYIVEIHSSVMGAGVGWTPVRRFTLQENATRYVREHGTLRGIA